MPWPEPDLQIGPGMFEVDGNWGGGVVVEFSHFWRSCPKFTGEQLAGKRK